MAETEKTVQLTEEGRKARNAYMRAYRKRNPEKMRAIRNRHLNKMGAMIAAAAVEDSSDDTNEGD